MNGYGRLSAIQRDIAGVTSEKLISELITLRDEVSREFDRETRRHFHGLTATRYYSGSGAREMWLGDDLLSITTIKIADTADQPTAFENTLTTATDYTLWPRNADGKPYRKIILNPDGEYSAWPVGVDNIQLVGKFGYSEEWQTAVVNGTAVTGTLASGTDTTLVLSLGGDVEPGDMLKVGSEEMEVTGVAGTTAIVVRGCNGTTAAAATDAAVYIRRYPRDVENVVKERTVARRWDSQGGYAGGITLSGDSMNAAGQTTGRGVYSRWRDTVGAYVNPAAVL